MTVTEESPVKPSNPNFNLMAKPHDEPKNENEGNNDLSE